MGFVVLGAVLVIYYGGERSVALYRKLTIDKRRAKAEYPITANDPMGRIIV